MNTRRKKKKKSVRENRALALLGDVALDLFGVFGIVGSRLAKEGVSARRLVVYKQIKRQRKRRKRRKKRKKEGKKFKKERK